MEEMSSKQKKLEKEVARGLSALGMDDYHGTKITINSSAVGICKDCNYTYLAKTKYGKVIGKCFEMDIKLSGIDPIEECCL